MLVTLSLCLLIEANDVRKFFFSHMKWRFMKRREVLEFLAYLPWSMRYKLLKREEWKWDTLYELVKVSLASFILDPVPFTSYDTFC